MSVPGSGSEPGSSGPPTPHPADGTPPDLQDDPSFQADLLAHVTDAVVAVDGQNRIVYWNQAAERTYGWAADEMLGGDARTILHPELTIEELESRTSAIRETGRWHEEIVHHRKDGSLVDVEAYTVLHGLPDGSSALISINRDITSRKRTDRERERNLRRLEGLHQIAIAILESKTTEELARLALSRLSELVPATRLSLSRFDPSAEELVVLQVLALAATQVGVGARFPLAATGSAAGLLRGELNLVPDTLEVADPPPALQRLTDEGVRSYVNVPLMFEGSLVATMNLASDVPGAFQVEHLDIAREVSSMLAVGILQSDLREERRRRSDILEELVAERTLALAQREQQYRTLARLFPDGIVAMFDRDLRYSFVDGMALVSAGLSGDEFQGRTLWEAPHDPDSVLVFEPAFRAALEGIPSVFEMRAQDRDFLVHVVPVDGEGVAIVGGLMASVDITDRKRAEADLARFAAIVESADDAIYSKTLAGTITSWNRGAEKLYGFPAAEAIGQPVSIICPPGREDELSAILEAVRAGVPVEHRETVRRRSDGRLIDVALTVSPVKADGIVTGASVIGHDITERKRFQRELLEAKDEAERANRAKDGFLSRMSHELRTPLNAVLGFAQVLEMDELSSDQRDSVEQIRRGGEHLLELINEVLDLSRIAGGGLRLSLERVAVSEALRDAVSLVQPLAAERGVSLRVEDADGLHVLADHQRLKQVLLNLLANAIKYNREGGEVSVGCEQTGEQGLRITVSDSGPGTSPEQMTRLFEPFERLGAEGGGVEGTGLGLTLSKALMVAMGGTIQVQSEVGVGSRFAIDLARAGSQDRDDQRPHPGFDEPKAGLTQIVLHVGDNLDDLRLVERILEQRPAIRLISAMQGQMALDLARRHRPSLILLDPHLPDIHGAQVLQALRRDAATKDIPVVMISADATRPEERQLLEAGASGYLTEPLDVRRFLEVVDGVLGGS